MLRTWRLLRTYLDNGTRRLTTLGVVSLVAGVFEALALVLAVQVAVGLARDGADSEVDLPLGLGALSGGGALAVALGATVVVIGLHSMAAAQAARMTADVLRAARSRILVAYAGASWSRQAAEREGTLQESASALAQKSANLVNWLSSAIAALVGVVALLAVAFLVDPVAAAVVVGIGVVIALALRPLARATRRRAAQFVDGSAAFSEEVSQLGSTAMELKVFGVLDTEIDRLEVLNERSSRLLERLRRAGRTNAFIFKDLAILLLVACVGLLYLAGADELSGIGTVAVLVIRAVAYAQQGQSALQGVVEEGPNLDLLTERIESLIGSGERFGNVAVEAVHEIELAHVTYRYSDGPPAVHDITLTVGRGEALGIIGPSGGGKSTLVQLLLRLRTPGDGTITVSGVPISEISQESWHRLVALVPQDPHLSEGTIADNVRFHRPWITDAAVYEAAAAAHVADDIDQLPLGFATRLGPRGSGLSGGQRQRVAIARALAGEPQLLVLDEPTSALDPRSEAELQRTIAELKGRVTMVIVAHRMSTLASCDRVLALSGGQVRALGSLDEAVRTVDFVQAEGLTG